MSDRDQELAEALLRIMRANRPRPVPVTPENAAEARTWMSVATRFGLSLPDAVIDQLVSEDAERARRARAARQFQRGLLLRAADTIGSAFEARSVAHVFLKGMASAALLPAELPGHSVDIDLMVAPRDAQAAYGLLSELGYRDARIPFADSRRLLHHHEMVSADNRINVELHWAIAAPWLGISVPVTEIVSRGRRTGTAPSARVVPEMADHLALLAIDLIKDEWNSPRKVLAFAHVAHFSDQDTRRTASDRVRAWGFSRGMAVSVALCADLLDLDLTPLKGKGDDTAELARVAQTRVLHVNSHKSARGRLRERLVLATKFDDPRKRLAYLWSLLVDLRIKRLTDNHGIFSSTLAPRPEAVTFRGD